MDDTNHGGTKLIIMKANLNLGAVSGIKIKVHWTFLFLILWIVFSEMKRGGNTDSILFNVALVLTVFLCVVLHELGHALTAKKFGIQTQKITLLPIGGMATMEKIPESPKQELLVTLAGPLVNIVIALLLYFIIPVKELIQLNFTEAFETFSRFTLQNFLFYLFVINIALVVFNLIPAFPMDGGRLLRALLAIKINRVKATQIASTIGQFIAVLFLLIGLLYNPFLVFIALVIFLGAYGENQMAHHLELLKGHTAKESSITNITIFSPQDTISKAVKAVITSTENNFVVIENNAVKGLLFYQDILENAKKEDTLIGDVMTTSFKTVDSNDDLKKVYQQIHGQKNSFFPVLEDGKLIGAIDAINLNEFIVLQSKRLS
ncbi:protease [Yeosuana aromativorans]|uniref:Zinc metalloprotease n=1 Tax=Yeosuana aromativorans TaxID=288019 RepID=A0A8J3BJ67_9FLAO|nr:site-2 protease family protein [Yeosuana aromativorans]GGK18131.1 protease [Yeosuana aromativorans]